MQTSNQISNLIPASELADVEIARGRLRIRVAESRAVSDCHSPCATCHSDCSICMSICIYVPPTM